MPSSPGAPQKTPHRLHPQHVLVSPRALRPAIWRQEPQTPPANPLPRRGRASSGGLSSPVHVAASGTALAKVQMEILTDSLFSAFFPDALASPAPFPLGTSPLPGRLSAVGSRLSRTPSATPARPWAAALAQAELHVSAYTNFPVFFASAGQLSRRPGGFKLKMEFPNVFAHRLLLWGSPAQPWSRTQPWRLEGSALTCRGIRLPGGQGSRLLSSLRPGEGRDERGGSRKGRPAPALIPACSPPGEGGCGAPHRDISRKGPRSCRSRRRSHGRVLGCHGVSLGSGALPGAPRLRL